MTSSPRFEAVEMPPGADELRAEVRAFLAAEKARGIPFSQQYGFEFSADFSQSAGRQGYIGMTWPKEYGGHERSSLERYVVIEEFLAAGAPTGAHWVADRQSGPLLLRFGTDEQRRKILPRIAAGECYFCIGMSEPDSGSDLASIRSRATRTEGGWQVNGTKLWTSGAHNAHYMIALVRTEAPGEDRHAGMSQMLIDMKSEGMEIRPVINLAGDHHFNEEIFTDCFVPDDMVIGEVGNGWNQVMSELGHERSGPERFLSTFQIFVELVRQIGPEPSDRAAEVLGRLAAHLMTLRQMSLSVAGMLERGQSTNIEAALVKDVGTSLQKEMPDIARTLMQAENDGVIPEGFVATLDESILYSPVGTIQGGAREILRGVVARGLGLR